MTLNSVYKVKFIFSNCNPYFLFHIRIIREKIPIGRHFFERPMVCRHGALYSNGDREKFSAKFLYGFWTLYTGEIFMNLKFFPFSLRSRDFIYCVYPNLSRPFFRFRDPNYCLQCRIRRKANRDTEKCSYEQANVFRLIKQHSAWFSSSNTSKK